MSSLLSFAQRLAALGYAPSTCTNYCARLRTLLSALGEEVVLLPLPQLQARLDDYFRAQNCAFSTQKQYISALKRFAQVCYERHLELRPTSHRPRRPLLILSRDAVTIVGNT